MSDRQALGWVLRNRRMAFAAHRAALAEQLRVRDELFLYTTRGCFYNPTRDRGRIIGTASVASDPTALMEPIELAGRAFTHGCDLRLQSLTPKGVGPELAAIRDRLQAFAGQDGWAVRLRTPLVALTESDAALLRRSLRALAREPERVLGEYLAAAVPAKSAYRGAARAS
jgi:hypothetical protein